MTSEEMQALRPRCASFAADEHLELYKSTKGTTRTLVANSVAIRRRKSFRCERGIMSSRSRVVCLQLPPTFGLVI